MQSGTGGQNQHGRDADAASSADEPTELLAFREAERRKARARELELSDPGSPGQPGVDRAAHSAAAHRV